MPVSVVMTLPNSSPVAMRSVGFCEGVRTRCSPSAPKAGRAAPSDTSAPSATSPRMRGITGGECTIARSVRRRPSRGWGPAGRGADTNGGHERAPPRIHLGSAPGARGSGRRLSGRPARPGAGAGAPATDRGARRADPHLDGAQPGPRGGGATPPAHRAAGATRRTRPGARPRGPRADPRPVHRDRPPGRHRRRAARAHARGRRGVRRRARDQVRGQLRDRGRRAQGQGVAALPASLHRSPPARGRRRAGPGGADPAELRGRAGAHRVRARALGALLGAGQRSRRGSAARRAGPARRGGLDPAAQGPYLHDHAALDGRADDPADSVTPFQPPGPPESTAALYGYFPDFRDRRRRVGLRWPRWARFGAERAGIAAQASAEGAATTISARASVAHFYLIVSQQEPNRYPYLKHVYANETMEVILDRRLADRRERQARPGSERRRTDRRTRNVSDALKQYGWVLARGR